MEKVLRLYNGVMYSTFTLTYFLILSSAPTKTTFILLKALGTVGITGDTRFSIASLPMVISLRKVLSV